MLIGWEVIFPTWGGPSRSGLLPNYRYGGDRFRGGAFFRTSAYVGLAGRLRRWLQFQFAPRSRSLPSRSDGRYLRYLSRGLCNVRFGSKADALPLKADISRRCHDVR